MNQKKKLLFLLIVNSTFIFLVSYILKVLLLKQKQYREFCETNSSIFNDNKEIFIKVLLTDFKSNLVNNNFFNSCNLIAKIDKHLTNKKDYKLYLKGKRIDIDEPLHIENIDWLFNDSSMPIIELFLKDKLIDVFKIEINSDIKKTLIINENNMPLKDWNNHLLKRFCYSKVEKIIIDGNYQKIHNGIFCKGWDELKCVILNTPNLETIGISAFENKTNLEQLKINCKNKISLEKDCFFNCKNLYLDFFEKIKTDNDWSFSESFNGIETIDLSMSNLTSINKRIFFNCKTLKKIILPYSVKQIDSYAFYGCENLVDINLENIKTIEKYAFHGCSKLEKINLEKALYIGEYAFSYCSSLSTINLPRINNIGQRCFMFCSNLKKVELSLKIKEISELAFYNCKNLEKINLANIKKIEDSAFYECSNLMVNNLLNLEVIADFAFYGCNAIKELEFKNLKELGESIFENCQNLEYVCFKQTSIIELSKRIFKGCINLNEVVLSPFIKTINDYAFLGCYELKNINLTDVNFIKRSAFENCKNLNNIDFENVEFIDNYAFSCCFNLFGINMKNVMKIGELSFMNCSSIEYLDMPKIQSIGSEAFSFCTSLKNICIGKNLQTIFLNSFDGCLSIKKLEFKKDLSDDVVEILTNIVGIEKMYSYK